MVQSQWKSLWCNLHDNHYGEIFVKISMVQSQWNPSSESLISIINSSFNIRKFWIKLNYKAAFIDFRTDFLWLLWNLTVKNDGAISVKTVMVQFQWKSLWCNLSDNNHGAISVKIINNESLISSSSTINLAGEISSETSSLILINKFSTGLFAVILSAQGDLMYSFRIKAKCLGF